MPTCRVKQCKSAAEIGPLCAHHHSRFLKNGVLDDLRAMSFEERLWSWVDRRGPDECWPWQMKSRQSGYGFISPGPKQLKVLAHRAVWEVTHGPIPKGAGYHGTVVMHTCDNRLCCNPAHLRLGTQADNVRDMREKGRHVDRPPMLGQDHPNAKLNPDAVREMRDRTKSRRYLATKYGVKMSAVDQVRSGRVWSHVT